jgi:hypothetical protein
MAESATTITRDVLPAVLLLVAKLVAVLAELQSVGVFTPR